GIAYAVPLRRGPAAGLLPARILSPRRSGGREPLRAAPLAAEFLRCPAPEPDSLVHRQELRPCPARCRTPCEAERRNRPPRRAATCRPYSPWAWHLGPRSARRQATASRSQPAWPLQRRQFGGESGILGELP